MASELELTVTERHHGSRLDVFISESARELSRSRCKTLIESGCVRVNGAAVEKPGFKVSAGDLASVRMPAPQKLDLAPADLALNILYEDEDVALVNKPANLSVHPSSTEKAATLVHGLLHQLKSLSRIGGVERPGIVHRIDKGTSGLLVVTKNDFAHEALSEQFQKHAIERRYIALVFGDLAQRGRSGTIATFFGRHPKDRKKMTAKLAKGRRAVTHWRVLEVFALGKKALTLAECRLETGRTHQIRVHLSELGFPIVGDPVYGDHARKAKDVEKTDKKTGDLLSKLDHQLLHAQTLGFVHPRSQKKLHFHVPPPPDFQDVLERMRKYAIPDSQ